MPAIWCLLLHNSLAGFSQQLSEVPTVIISILQMRKLTDALASSGPSSDMVFLINVLSFLCHLCTFNPGALFSLQDGILTVKRVPSGSIWGDRPRKFFCILDDSSLPQGTPDFEGEHASAFLEVA